MPADRPSDSEPPPLLAPHEIARRLGVSRPTVNRLIRSGRLASVRITDQILRVRPDVLQRFIADAEARAEARAAEAGGAS